MPRLGLGVQFELVSVVWIDLNYLKLRSSTPPFNSVPGIASVKLIVVNQDKPD